MPLGRYTGDNPLAEAVQMVMHMERVACDPCTGDSPFELGECKGCSYTSSDLLQSAHTD